MESLVWVDGEQVGNGEDGGSGIWSSKYGSKGIGNRKAMETKMGRGEVRIGAPVQGCTECNKAQIEE